MTVEAAVYDLLDGVVDSVGVELVDVEYSSGSLRVTIDAEGGVTTEQLTKVNRLVSPILDQHDPIPGRYMLEVTSPGLERPLRTPAHFTRAVGEMVIVKRHSDKVPRRIRGTLNESDEATITIEAVELDGVELDDPAVHQIDLATVSTARTIFEWGPQPKPGQPKKKKSSQPRGAR